MTSFHIISDIGQRARQGNYGVSGQVDPDLGGSALTSITAYRALRWDPVNDVGRDGAAGRSADDRGHVQDGPVMRGE